GNPLPARLCLARRSLAAVRAQAEPGHESFGFLPENRQVAEDKKEDDEQHQRRVTEAHPAPIFALFGFRGGGPGDEILILEQPVETGRDEGLLPARKRARGGKITAAEEDRSLNFGHDRERQKPAK